MRMISTIVALAGFMLLAGCSEPSSDQKDSETVNLQQEQFARVQPVPTFNFSLERDVYIQLYKARNENVATHTVWRSALGKVLGDCASIGYPLPYDSSLTNPAKIERRRLGTGVNKTWYSGIIEQAEPNGLYSSKNSIATWIRCVVVVNEVPTTVPVYVEDQVTTYPYPVEVNYETDRVLQAGAPAVVLTAK